MLRETAKKLGKGIGDDFRERKLTLPFIKAIAKATEEERKFWIRTIEKGEQVDGDWERALLLLQNHGAIEQRAKMRWNGHKRLRILCQICRTSA